MGGELEFNQHCFFPELNCCNIVLLHSRLSFFTWAEKVFKENLQWIQFFNRICIKFSIKKKKSGWMIWRWYWFDWQLTENIGYCGVVLLKTRFAIQQWLLSGCKMAVLMLLLIAANWHTFDKDWAKAEGTLLSGLVLSKLIHCGEHSFYLKGKEGFKGRSIQW